MIRAIVKNLMLDLAVAQWADSSPLQRHEEVWVTLVVTAIHRQLHRRDRGMQRPNGSKSAEKQLGQLLHRPLVQVPIVKGLQEAEAEPCRPRRNNARNRH